MTYKQWCDFVEGDSMPDGSDYQGWDIENE